MRIAILALTLVTPTLAQTRWYVDAANTPPGTGTKADPYSSIQYGIDQATTLDGDALVVASGTYVETVDFRGKAITVDGSASTTLPVLDAPAPGRIVVFQSGEGPDSVLRGFEITDSQSHGGGGVLVDGAMPTLEGLELRGLEDIQGGALWSENGGARVVGCTFEGNHATFFAGGAVSSSGSNDVYEDCRFVGNTAPGGGAAANGTFLRCTFTGNTALRAGGALSGAHAIECTIEGNEVTMGSEGGGGGAYGCLLEDCTVTGNRSTDYGGGATFCTVIGGEVLFNRCVPGIYAARGGGLYRGTAEGVRIRGNRATGNSFGGGVHDTVLVDCVVIGNRAKRGGGAYYFTSLEPIEVIASSTIVGNVAELAGGVQYSGKSGGSLVESIVWGNAPKQILSSNQFVVRYSCVEGGYAGPGIGNIGVDPQLFGVTGSDAHLLAGSPCIDAGDPSSPPDPDGSPSDIGALPFDGVWTGGAFSYCAPKRTKEGCLAHATASGTPSLTGPDDFVVGAVDVPPGVTCVLVVGTDFEPVPATGSVLCIGSSARRLATGPSTPSSNPCGGTFRRDVSQATLVALGLAPGDRLYSQVWFTQPTPGLRAATDALEAYVMP